jgi:hypothetical protein
MGWSGLSFKEEDTTQWRKSTSCLRQSKRSSSKQGFTMATLRFVPAAVAPQLSEGVAARVDAAIRAVDALTMEPLTSREQLSDRLADLRAGSTAKVLLCELGGGVLDFVSAAFPSRGERCVLAQRFHREPLGRGAHFDVYGQLLDEEFPWVAIFNIAGDAEVSTFSLPEGLARRYAEEHPVPSDAAYEARRIVAAEALADPAVRVDKGVLYKHSGLILPQLKAGPHWVHEVVPLNSGNPGQFIKLLVPANNEGARKQLGENGYAPLDGVLTAALHLESNAWVSSNEALPQRRRCNLD